MNKENDRNGQRAKSASSAAQKYVEKRKKRWWRKIALGIGVPTIGFLLPLLLIISIFGAVMSSASEAFVEDYKTAAELISGDWHDILAFDTIRYNNELEEANPFASAMEFLVVEYHLYEKKVDPETGVEYWIVVNSGVLNTSKSVTDFFRVRPDVNQVIAAILKYEQPKPWEFSIYSKTIEEVMDEHDFNDEQREWAGVLLTDGVLAAQFGEDLPDFIAAGTGNGYFAWPLPGIPESKATSSYGNRWHPVDHVYKFHYGTDIGCPTGTPVIAVADGVVRSAGYGNSSGNFVTITHQVDGRTWTTKYFHLSEIKATVGQEVQTGTVIGLSGNTGKSTGPHLHIETLCNGQYQNPLPLITGNGGVDGE